MFHAHLAEDAEQACQRLQVRWVFKVKRTTGPRSFCLRWGISSFRIRSINRISNANIVCTCHWFIYTPSLSALSQHFFINISNNRDGTITSSMNSADWENTFRLNLLFVRGILRPLMHIPLNRSINWSNRCVKRRNIWVFIWIKFIFSMQRKGRRHNECHTVRSFLFRFDLAKISLGSLVEENPTSIELWIEYLLNPEISSELPSVRRFHLQFPLSLIASVDLRTCLCIDGSRSRIDLCIGRTMMIDQMDCSIVESFSLRCLRFLHCRKIQRNFERNANDSSSIWVISCAKILFIGSMIKDRRIFF